MIAIEIREALEKSYPDVTDLEFSIEHSGSAHEHPLIAIGVLLISSIVLERAWRARDFRQQPERWVSMLYLRAETQACVPSRRRAIGRSWMTQKKNQGFGQAFQAF